MTPARLARIAATLAEDPPRLAACRLAGVALLAEVTRLVARTAELEGAIRAHRGQKADDRCWLDDQSLYAAIGDGDLGDNRVGDKAAMLANCSRYLDRRCEGGHWPSYAEVEAERDALRARVGELEAARRGYPAAPVPDGPGAVTLTSEDYAPCLPLSAGPA